MANVDLGVYQAGGKAEVRVEKPSQRSEPESGSGVGRESKIRLGVKVGLEQDWSKDLSQAREGQEQGLEAGAGQMQLQS